MSNVAVETYEQAFDDITGRSDLRKKLFDDGKGYDPETFAHVCNSIPATAKARS